MSPARQKLLFAGIVVVLAVFGYLLVVPALHKNSAAPKPSATPTVAAPTPSTAQPVATQLPDGSVNIYNWLPFTQPELADAAALVVRFAEDYDTFTYTEDAAAYVNKMGSMITSELAATLRNAYSTPGVASLRTGQQQVSTATASIVSLRAFGSSSLTFLVNIDQRLTSSRGSSSSSTQFAVTLTGSGDTWQVSDVEYASAGNT
jgi:hypothetical protein